MVAGADEYYAKGLWFVWVMWLFGDIAVYKHSWQSIKIFILFTRHSFNPIQPIKHQNPLVLNIRDSHIRPLIHFKFIFFFHLHNMSHVAYGCIVSIMNPNNHAISKLWSETWTDQPKSKTNPFDWLKLKLMNYHNMSHSRKLAQNGRKSGKNS